MKNIDNLLNNHINNVVAYLSNYIDVKDIIRKYKECEYIVTEDKEQELKVGKITQKLDLKKDLGTVISPVYMENGKYKLINPKLYLVKSNITNQDISCVLFHELMHVASTKQLVKEGEKYYQYSGVQKEEVTMCDKKYNNKAIYLNEGLTELVSKVIYDDIYDADYPIIKYVNTKMYKSSYNTIYFLLAFLLLNYFEENKEVLFDIYFNNNIELLRKTLKEQCNMELEKIIDISEIVFKIMTIDNPLYEKMINKLDKKNKLLNKKVIKQYNTKAL